MQSQQGKTGDAAEAPFEIEELFFSRTDARGVIQSGNSVFQRVSGYGWDDLIGSPHKIIRHNDMPAAVFHLLWSTITSGHPIGAFVKNRTKSGGHYWVFAIVTPVEGGYLSVRLKPSTELLATISAEYASLRAPELAREIGPQDSGAALLERLNRMGWRDYNAFMAQAAVAEVCARDRAIGAETGSCGSAMQRILDDSAENLRDAARVLRLCERLKNSAINLSIHSAKNAAHRQLFQVISANFARVCDQLKARMQAFITAATEVSDRINSGLFLLVTARLQAESAAHFRNDGIECDAMDRLREGQLLDRQSALYGQRARDSLQDMLTEIRAFQWQCDDALEQAGRLGMTGTVGLIETARLDRGGAVTFKLLEETAEIQHQMEDGLKAIVSRNTRMEGDIASANGYGFCPGQPARRAAAA